MDTHPLAWVEAKSIAVTQRIAFIGVVGMLAVGILTTIDVVIFRWMFASPIPGSNEVLTTIFAVAIAAVLASGLAQRANLEINMLKGVVGVRATAWFRSAGSALFLLTLILLAWRVAIYAAQETGRGQVTVILQWHTWPFLWTITVLVALCVPAQLVALLASVGEALRDCDEPTAASTDAPSSDRRILIPATRLIVAILVLMGVIYLVVGDAQPVAGSHPVTVAVVFLFVLWALILGLVPVSAALLICGLLGTATLMGWPNAFNVLGSETVGLITNADLAVIPLFLMMGGFANASGLSSDIYRLAHALLGFQRGGLALATVGGCAGFGALTGSSLATVATMGSVALPEMRQRGYAPALSTGCIAAGGTLGQLVPPSTAIVVYALLVEQSIGRLYIAVLVPAALTAAFYMLAIWLSVRLNPLIAPGRQAFDALALWEALKRSIGMFVMFGAVIGGIYAGIFTATEAASVGAAIAFVMALIRGKLSKGALWQVVGETTRTTAIIYFVIIGAMMISFFIGTSGLPASLTEALASSGLPHVAIIVLLVIFYLVLGSIMDAFTIMIITAPLAAAVIAQIGYDQVWWGIMMVVLVEMGVVTPPFGINLFMMKTLAPDVPLTTIYRGVMPFVAVDILKVVLLIAFPVLALWLPSMAFR
jgi:C4-dicarboxylate transporter DctM subunit